MHDWHNILVNPTSNVSEAIEVLDTNDARIVLVVDKNKTLLGTITDGDVRRGLLKGCTLETPVTEVMNKDPKVTFDDNDKGNIKRRMEQISVRQMPVVDANMVVTGLETLQKLVKQEKYDNPVFIMAGGFGTRLKPLTEDIPKPMLKIGSKPILERIMEGFIQAGFHDFYISTHYKAEMINDYFGDGSQLGANIQYVHEDEPLGTAGALSLLPKSVNKLPIIMMNGDILTNIDYRNLISFHNEQAGIATVCVKEYDFVIPYGVVEGQKNQIESITEKPVTKFLINAGIYVLDPSLVTSIPESLNLSMPDLLDNLLRAGDKVTMFPIYEYWLDIGQREEFDRAQNEIQWIEKT